MVVQSESESVIVGAALAAITLCAASFAAKAAPTIIPSGELTAFGFHAVEALRGEPGSCRFRETLYHR